jgi:hypothetical protein
MKPVETEPETSAQYQRFKALLGKVLAVPRSKIMEREDHYRYMSANDPSRPGPKPGTKRKKRADPGPADQPRA